MFQTTNQYLMIYAYYNLLYLYNGTSILPRSYPWPMMTANEVNMEKKTAPAVPKPARCAWPEYPGEMAV